MNNLSIFCADVGSIKANKFGWAGKYADGKVLEGHDIEVFAYQIAEEIGLGNQVALGFECPMYVPMREIPEKVNSARNGEGNRSWSAGAGTGALATGLVEMLWVMNTVSGLLGNPPKAVFDWTEAEKPNAVFLWEAFVTSTAKGVSHSEDALIAIDTFSKALPDPWSANAVIEADVLSLVGAAALRAGWTDDSAALSKPCVVIKA